MNNRYTAFSLFELLLVISLSALVLVCTVSGWRYLLEHNQLSVLSNRIVGAVRAAQAAAMARHQAIIFCGSSNQRQCDGQWSAGQLLLVAYDHQVLKHYAALPSGYTLHWRSSLARHHALQFNINGSTNGQQGHFALIHHSNTVTITVLRSGYLRRNLLW